jgi:hypothetical protein
VHVGCVLFYCVGAVNKHFFFVCLFKLWKPATEAHEILETVYEALSCIENFKRLREDMRT